jgi:glycosyltransferase involved in cell wall biosynthesis
MPLQRSLKSLRPRPEVIHIQCASVQTAPILWYAARNAVPLVVTSQGETVMDEHDLYRHSAYMRMTFRLAARTAAALTACSMWTRERCRAYSPRFASATVIPNGVDSSQWDVGSVTTSPVLCAWGRHVHQKGFDLAIRAFALLRQRIGDARLLIGGEGSQTSELRRISGPGVEFVGALDRAGVRDLLSASRVVVVPSRVEPFGIVALEALAAGRGLVYARHTGLVEAAGTLGRPTDVGNPRALADAMRAELLCPTSSEAGRARARQFDWDCICEKYLDIYRAVRR